MGTGDILLGGNPVMDYHPVQGRVAILLGMLYAKETWIRSGRLGLWLLCALTFFISYETSRGSTSKKLQHSSANPAKLYRLPSSLQQLSLRSCK